jgi:hypothetical protein
MIACCLRSADAAGTVGVFVPKAERHPATLQHRPADLLRPSADVRWCTCSAAGIVTQLVIQPLPGVASSTPSARCRRPKAKYDSGPTPAELTSTAATIQSRFEPRIWLAGRCLMSMSTAVLRMASAIAAAMISLR